MRPAVRHAVLLDALFDFVAQAEAVEGEDAGVHDLNRATRQRTTLRRYRGRFAHGDVPVIDVLIKPCDKGFWRPVAHAAQVEHLLVQRGDEIGFVRFSKLFDLDIAFGADVERACRAGGAHERIVGVGKGSILGAELPRVFDQEGAFKLEQVCRSPHTEPWHTKSMPRS